MSWGNCTCSCDIEDVFASHQKGFFSSEDGFGESQIDIWALEDLPMLSDSKIDKYLGLSYSLVMFLEYSSGIWNWSWKLLNGRVYIHPNEVTVTEAGSKGVAHLLPLHGADCMRHARHGHGVAAHGLHQTVLGQRQGLVHGGQADQVVVVVVVVEVGVAVQVVGMDPQGAGHHHALNGAPAAVLGDGGAAEVSVGFPATQRGTAWSTLSSKCLFSRVQGDRGPYEDTFKMGVSAPAPPQPRVNNSPICCIEVGNGEIKH